MYEDGWKWMKMDGKCRKFLVIGMNDWKWHEMTGSGNDNDNEV